MVRRITITILLALLSLPTFSNAGPLAAVGDAAPVFTSKLSTGSVVRLNQYRGRTVLLTFWATWCAPCLRELPEIDAAYSAFKQQGLDVLAINFGEDTATINTYLKKQNLALPVTKDEELDIANAYGVFALPKTFFINPDGVITKVVVGGSLTTENIGDIINRKH